MVYDTSALKPEAALRLLGERESEGPLHIYRRRDGTLLTTDCPPAAHRRRVRRAVLASTALILTASFATALQPSSRGIRDKTPIVRADRRALHAAASLHDELEDWQAKRTATFPTER
jgi:hypothetical protein